MDYSKERTLPPEAGTTFVEFTLIFPLCLLMFAVIFESGMMLNQYQILKRISYSAARMAVDFPNLDVKTYTDAPTDAGTHFELQMKIRTLE